MLFKGNTVYKSGQWCAYPDANFIKETNLRYMFIELEKVFKNSYSEDNDRKTKSKEIIYR